MSLNSFGGMASASAFVVTPDDNNDLPSVTRGIYIGGSGNLVCILQDDTTSITFTALAGGVIYSFQIKRILSSGTTATNIIGLR